MDWMPIETWRGRDGDEALIWDGYNVSLANYDAFRKNWWVLGEYTINNPTHWMPLPPPPNNATVAGSGEE